MKVAWFTPLSTRSAIAEYSVCVGAALALRCDVDLWAGDETPWRRAPISVIDGRNEPASRALAAYDHVIYNLGDHPGFHRAVYDVSRRHPGICLLHDRSYDNLLAEHLRDGVSSFRVAIAGALGVLVHSDDHAREVEGEWFGPVGRIQFPAYPQHLSRWGGHRPRPEERPRTVLTVGYVNPNKQVHRVLELLHREPDLQARLRYVVVGPAPDAAYARALAGQIERYGLDRCVQLVLGHQSDADFQRHLDDADAFVNLREPPLESASASFLEQLACGKPIVVSDLGYFSEVPDDTVLKVPAGDDQALRQRLWQIATAGALLQSVGESARTYAAALTVDRTAEGILRFLAEVGEWRPLIDLTRRAASELASFRASSEAPVIDQIAVQIAPMARS